MASTANYSAESHEPSVFLLHQSTKHFKLQMKVRSTHFFLPISLEKRDQIFLSKTLSAFCHSKNDIFEKLKFNIQLYSLLSKNNYFSHS